MIDFATLQGLNIPEGVVTKIEVDGVPLWKQIKYRYVSLGDSIAAGHRIDDNWETDYGENAQYGVDGRIATEIVPNSYTDKIRQYLCNIYGAENISTKSFARSGSMIRREPVDSRSLIDILDDKPVQVALSQANLVTISIGANTILEPALNIVSDFLIDGIDLAPTEVFIENALRNLANPNYEYSYKALFDKLVSINPNARYVFTTIYNPMKYLYIERGTWDNDFRDGLFGVWVNTVPQMTILGWEVDKEIKKSILDQPAFVNLRERINGNGSDWEGISAWTERYLETGGLSVHDGEPYLGLNQIIRNAIKDYNNPNFTVTETHKLFDTVPDRQGAGDLHYNDLVNVQITRGYDANDMNWEALWGNAKGSTVDEKITNYWTDAIYRHISSSGFDVSGLATELMPTIINDVLVPAFDPHPRTDGQYAMMRSFLDTLGWESLPTVTYNANGGSGVMSSQKVLNTSIVNGVSKSAYSILKPNSFIGQTGYYFTGWNTVANGSGTSYSNGQSISINGNLTLYAQWSNIYTITYKHTNHTGGLYGDDETGHKECYALWIAGTEQADFGKFSEGTQRTIPVAYGTRVGVVVSGYNPSEITYDDADTDVYWNGVSVAQGYGDTPAMYEFTLIGDVTIDFQWKISGSLVTFNAKSWEDCYITTHY